MIGGGWKVLGILVLLSLALSVPGTSPADAASGDRALVSSSQLTKRPFRGVVLVSVSGGVVCTGFVVAPRKVVTAAHCLSRNASRGDYRLRRGLPGNVRLYRAYSLAVGGSTYASCGAARVWAHPRFIRRNANDRRFGSRAHDYAVITTAAGCVYPRSAVNRMWATTQPSGRLRVGARIKLAGYPSDPRVEDMNGLNMWRTRGDVRPAGSDPRLLDVTGFVAQGMSGGPIWRSFGQRPSPCGRKQCIVAILTECSVNPRGLCRLGDSGRRAVRITPTVKKVIKRH